MREIGGVFKQTAYAARCQNNISCKNCASFAVCVFNNYAVAGVVFFYNINHRCVCNKGDVFLGFCNCKQGCRDFFAGFVLMMQNPVLPVGSFSCVVEIAAVIGIKVNTQLNKRADNIG